MSELAIYSRQLASPPDDVNLVHDLLASVWADTPSIGMTDRFSFETALVELAANVIQHADGGSGISYVITIRIVDGRIEATLIDTGEHAKVEIAKSVMPDDSSESGRGIPLIKALVDHLSYDRDGDLNKWQITRKLTQ
jgi:serine/threonine-protein kinase RsbW